MKHLFSQTIVTLTVGVMSHLAQANTLTLNEVIEHTIKSNPEVEAARYEARAIRREVSGARAGYYPRLDATLGVGRERTESPATGGEEVDLTRNEAALQLRQTLFDGGATSSEVKRQKSRYKSALYEAQAVRENAALRASEVYIDLLRNQKLLELVTESLEEHQNIYDQTALRLRSGVGSQADLDQIGARLALAQNNVLSGQNNVADSIANFEKVVGYELDDKVLQKPQAISSDVFPADLSSAINLALENHPTFLSAKADVKAAQSQYEASKSNFYPNVQLEGDKTWNEDIDGIEGDNDDAVIAVRMRYNLFNGGADKARKKQTAQLITQSKEIRNNTYRQVVESLSLSWNAKETTAKQLELLDRYIVSVSSTKSAYRKQFNIGRRTLLDLLNTENELVDARRNYINAEHDALYSNFRVLNGLGLLTKEVLPQ